MTAFQSMLSHPAIQRLGWGLVHSLWQAAAVAVLLAAALGLMRRASANARYLVACAGLALMVLLPAATLFLVSVPGPVPELPEPETTLPIAMPVEAPAALPVTDLEAVPSALPPALPLPPKTPWHQLAAAKLEPALPWLVLAWLAGVLGLSVWNLGGWAQLQRLKRRMTTPVAQELRDRADRLAERLGVRRAVAIVQSALMQVPAVIGWLKPVILLPASALTGLSAGELEALIAHELAHVRRHDYLVNLVQTAIEILGFYHPAVWWVSRRIRIERENCCDDMAAALAGDHVLYARALATMEELRGQQGLAVAASGGSLFERIRRLGGDQGERRPTWLPAAVAVAVIVALAVSGEIAMSSANVGKMTNAAATLQKAEGDISPAPVTLDPEHEHASDAWDDLSIEMTITVSNRTREERVVEVSELLPAMLEGGDYVDIGALRLEYLEREDRYRIYGRIVQTPLETMIYTFRLRGQKFADALGGLSSREQKNEDGTVVTVSYSRPRRPDILIEIDGDGMVSLDGAKMSETELQSRLPAMAAANTNLLIVCSLSQQAKGQSLWGTFSGAGGLSAVSLRFGSSLRDAYGSGFQTVDEILKPKPPRIGVTILDADTVRFRDKDVELSELPALLRAEGVSTNEPIDVYVARDASIRTARNLFKELAEAGYLRQGTTAKMRTQPKNAGGGNKPDPEPSPDEAVASSGTNEKTLGTLAEVEPRDATGSVPRNGLQGSQTDLEALDGEYIFQGVTITATENALRKYAVMDALLGRSRGERVVMAGQAQREIAELLASDAVAVDRWDPVYLSVGERKEADARRSIEYDPGPDHKGTPARSEEWKVGRRVEVELTSLENGLATCEVDVSEKQHNGWYASTNGATSTPVMVPIIRHINFSTGLATRLGEWCIAIGGHVTRDESEDRHYLIHMFQVNEPDGGGTQEPSRLSGSDPGSVLRLAREAKPPDAVQARLEVPHGKNVQGQTPETLKEVAADDGVQLGAVETDAALHDSAQGSPGQQQQEWVRLKLGDLKQQVSTGSFELPVDAGFITFYISAPSNAAAIAALAATFEIEYDVSEYGKRIARQHGFSTDGYWWGNISPAQDLADAQNVPGPWDSYHVVLPLRVPMIVDDGEGGSRQVRGYVDIGGVSYGAPNRGKFEFRFAQQPPQDCELWCVGLRNVKGADDVKNLAILVPYADLLDLLEQGRVQQCEIQRGIKEWCFFSLPAEDGGMRCKTEIPVKLSEFHDLLKKSKVAFVVLNKAEYFTISVVQREEEPRYVVDGDEYSEQEMFQLLDRIAATDPTDEIRKQRVEIAADRQTDYAVVLRLLDKLRSLDFMSIHMRTEYPKTQLEFRLAESQSGQGLTEAVIQGTDQKVWLHEEVLLSSADVESAQVADRDGKPVIALLFTEEGGRKFADITRNNKGKQIAILVAGKVMSAPLIREEIKGRKAEIAGSFTREEAERIAAGLAKKPWPEPPKEVFGPVVELTVYDARQRKGCFVDLDEGKLFDVPEEDLDNTTPELYRALSAKGIDAVYDSALRNFVGMDMIAIEVQNELWGWPAAFGDMAVFGSAGTLCNMSAKGDLPATFLFRTREGGRGLLQLMELLGEPAGVKIRYKLVQRGDGGMRAEDAVRASLNQMSEITVRIEKDGSIFLAGQPVTLDDIEAMSRLPDLPRKLRIAVEAQPEVPRELLAAVVNAYLTAGFENVEFPAMQEHGLRFRGQAGIYVRKSDGVLWPAFWDEEVEKVRILARSIAATDVDIRATHEPNTQIIRIRAMASSADAIVAICDKIAEAYVAQAVTGVEKKVVEKSGTPLVVVDEATAPPATPAQPPATNSPPVATASNVVAKLSLPRENAVMNFMWNPSKAVHSYHWFTDGKYTSGSQLAPGSERIGLTFTRHRDSIDYVLQYATDVPSNAIRPYATWCSDTIRWDPTNTPEMTLPINGTLRINGPTSVFKFAERTRDGNVVNTVELFLSPATNSPAVGTAGDAARTNLVDLLPPEQRVCLNNLRQLDAAKQQVAMAEKLADGAELPPDKLTRYIKGGLGALVCPSGGSYTPGVVGTEPRCSFHGMLGQAKTNVRVVFVPEATPTGRSSTLWASKAQWIAFQDIPEGVWHFDAFAGVGGSFPVYDGNGTNLFNITVLRGDDSSLTLKVDSPYQSVTQQVPRDGSFTFVHKGTAFQINYPSRWTTPENARMSVRAGISVFWQDSFRTGAMPLEGTTARDWTNDFMRLPDDGIWHAEAMVIEAPEEAFREAGAMDGTELKRVGGRLKKVNVGDPKAISIATSLSSDTMAALMARKDCRTNSFGQVTITMGEEKQVDKQVPFQYASGYTNGMPTNLVTRGLGRKTRVKFVEVKDDMPTLDFHFEDVSLKEWRTQTNAVSGSLEKQPVFSVRSVTSTTQAPPGVWMLSGSGDWRSEPEGPLTVFALRVQRPYSNIWQVQATWTTNGTIQFRNAAYSGPEFRALLSKEGISTNTAIRIACEPGSANSGFGEEWQAFRDAGFNSTVFLAPEPKHWLQDTQQATNSSVNVTTESLARQLAMIRHEQARAWAAQDGVQLPASEVGQGTDPAADQEGKAAGVGR